MRQIVNFNASWVFSKAAEAVPATLPADWENICLPHSWNAVDGQDGGNDYYRGTAYYAKKVVKAEFPSANRYYLELQGANSSADVYLDGKRLAHHDGGYSTWRVDLTAELKACWSSLWTTAPTRLSIPRWQTLLSTAASIVM